MSVLEGNALRYAAGHVVHHVFKGVKKSSHELKGDITDCLVQLVLGKQEDCEQGTAEEWTNLLDRGGLWHVRKTTFQVFYALEEGVRRFLSELSSPAVATGLKAKFVATLVTNDDVQFHWSIATAAFNVDDTKVHEQPYPVSRKKCNQEAVRALNTPQCHFYMIIVILSLQLLPFRCTGFSMNNHVHRALLENT